MTSLAISLVVVSAVLHAGWNLICKTRKSPGAVFFLILTIGTVALWTPLVAWIHQTKGFEIPAAAWGILVLSGLANAVYYVSLGRAYKLSDISMSYPLVKALPILIVTAFCIMAGTGKDGLPASMSSTTASISGLRTSFDSSSPLMGEVGWG